MFVARRTLVAGLRQAQVHASSAARPAVRSFTNTSRVLAGGHGKEISVQDMKVSKNLEEATGPNALFGPGGQPNEIPSDFDQATGLERLELLGKLEGIDIFDSQPLVQDRKGTMEDPFVIDSWDRVRYVGCTGFPAGSQEVNWLKVEEGKISRDWESGCVYTLNYLGPKDDGHH